MHGLPARAPTVAIIATEMDSQEGEYIPTSNGGPRLLLDPRARSPRLLLAHEVAHYLLDELLGLQDEAELQRSPLLERWRQAVGRTVAVQRLREEQQRIQEVLSGYRPPPFRTSTLLALLSYLTYGLRQSELFARSYAQFIATMSGHIRLRSELDDELARWRSVRVYLPGQWEADDYLPVAEALAQLLKQQGWM